MSFKIKISVIKALCFYLFKHNVINMSVIEREYKSERIAQGALGESARPLRGIIITHTIKKTYSIF